MKWSSLHPALQDVAYSVQTPEGEGGAPLEASCCCPRGTKCWVLLACGCATFEGRRFMYVGMILGHIQEEHEARKVTDSFI